MDYIINNVSSHKVELLDAIFKEANVQVGYFPPNMTQFLQVLDLIINRLRAILSYLIYLLEKVN